ncbi:AAA family ATPase [Glycomyces luteolus]|uniref:AAA family ATPase n=1 Tax=Glycomyces luteolus TaxID=2670330 RepID=A0A9X3P9M3_9ACTN|nr:AAA family ATPase [Glycomyces luteolus]MDA1360136.1 AAA family ATPase [Glycomyces luteolus]
MLTGTPGAGKTTILGHLAAAGHTATAETATDLITEAQAAGDPLPWNAPGFLDAIADEQARRQRAADTLPGPVQYFDRSPVCTLALARLQNRPVGPALAAELDRIKAEAVYERRVLFVEHLGFITRTEARRIGFEEALHFERIHRAAYRELGYECVPVPPAPAAERAALVLRLTTENETVD